MERGLGWRAWLLVAATAAAALCAIVAPAFPQPLSYHDFADDRGFLGVPNFLNVVSNVPFALAGAYGLAVTLARAGHRFACPDERLPYIVLFVGSVLTAFGSAYYHAEPDNERLVWDRLPMTLGFAGLTAAVAGERIHRDIARRALWPLLLVGVATVLYWSQTERLGRGNVLPYAIYQAWTMGVLVFAAIAFPARRYSHGAALWWVVALYAVAKLAEAFDLALLGLGQIVSGHTLKHVLAAAAVLVIAETVRRRVTSPASGTLSPASRGRGSGEEVS